MISIPLMKQSIKSNITLWGIFTAVLCIFIAVITAVINTETLSSMIEAFKGTPMAEIMGDRLETMGSFMGMLSQNFYGMNAVILPMIYIIIVGNSLIASQVDKGSMAYVLSTPTKRTTVAITQALYLVGSLLLMYMLITIVGLVAGNIYQPDFEIGKFIALNIGGFLLLFAISGISFFSSCFFNLSKNSLAIGAGLPLAFFIFKMMAEIGDDLKIFKYFSLNTLYDTNAIIAGGDYTSNFVILAAIGVMLYIAGIWVFKEKDLPL